MPNQPAKGKVAIFVRCTGSEKRKLQDAARKSRRSLSEYVLIAALDRAERDEQTNEKRSR